MEENNHSERLVRVEAFSELRAGILVVVKECFCDQPQHRGILGNRLTGTLIGHTETQDFFPVFPETACALTLGTGYCVNRSAVEGGHVWRVVVDDNAESHEVDVSMVEARASRLAREGAF